MAESLSDKLFSVLATTSTENTIHSKANRSNPQGRCDLKDKNEKQKVEGSSASDCEIAMHQMKIGKVSSRFARGPHKTESISDNTTNRKSYRSKSLVKVDFENKIEKQMMNSSSFSDHNIVTPGSVNLTGKMAARHANSDIRPSHATKRNTKYSMVDEKQSRNRGKDIPCHGTSFAKTSAEKAKEGTVMRKRMEKFIPNTDNACVQFNKQQTFSKYHSKNPSTNLDRHTVHRPDRDKANFGEMQKTSHTIKGTGFKFLEKLLDEEPTEVVIKLASPKTGFDEFLKKEMYPDLVFLILRVIAEKVCVAGFQHNKINVLIAACEMSFLDQLSKHIIDLLTEETQARIAKILQFFENLLIFYESILALLPSTAREKFKNLFIKTEMSILGVKNYHNINTDMIKKKFDALFSQLKLKIEEHERESVKESSRMEQMKYLPPPNDFRNCNIFPTIEDFTEKPFLRPSIIKGAYIDVHHYLDVQFRLLREDFIGPLRQGISQYVEHSAAGNKGLKYIENIKIYRDVTFMNTLAVKDKVGLLLNFDPNKKLQNVQWDYSKRFMFGSLLCFTADNFGSFFFGTVLERNKKMLEEGLISVQLYNEVSAEIFNCKFTMAESEVYFEPYRQVLKALQSLPPKEFPMKPYIVDGSIDAVLPLYISSRSPHIVTYNIGDFEVPVAELDCWPSADDLKMDLSQHRSFQNALTKEFVIIQGPPGTGKTYLGLKIIETLLENQNAWNDDARPILVVCYTNHALDQVLEGILKFTQKLIRVGGQSQSEVLTRFNLSEARKNCLYRKSAATSREIFQRMQAVLNDINSLQKQMDSISDNYGIISIHTLKQIGISSKHLDSFKTKSLDSDDIFVEWLTEAVESFVYDENLGLYNAGFYHPENVDENGVAVEEDEDDDDDDENHMRKTWLEETYEIPLVRPTNVNVSYVLDLQDLLAKIRNVADQVKHYREDLEKLQKLQQEWSFLQCHYRFLQQQLQQRFEAEGHVIEQLLRVNNLWDLNNTQRWMLYKHWCSRLNLSYLNTACQLREEYQRLCLQYDEIRDMQDLQVMQEALVIGMTTSGAARKRPLLRELKPRIVVVEEAAEVLESHIVVSLTKECEHLILIGDHRQLRPSTAVYELARKFNFDVSLFERMLKNGMHYDCLEVQHRMRPEIVKLITPTIYTSLQNAPSVHHYPDVLGVTKNLYFIDHKFYEEKVAEIVSHRNLFEAEFLIAFCRYLLLQGYKDSEITVLTTYSGQMYYLKRLKKESGSLGNVRITIVDNFQGEENRIILLSLVRSNEEGKIGFLKVENRVCVALSRAREGFFIIGNMHDLTSGSKIWPKIKEVLEEQGSFGPHLTLRCQVHPSQETKVACAADFKAVAEGGCSLLCDTLLSCGHKCRSVCHVQNRFHENYKCFLPCERIPENCPLGHVCLKKCYQVCGDCEMPLEKVLPCKHVTTLACYVDVREYKCKEPLQVELKLCGHKNTKLCFQEEQNVHCQISCEDRLPCGHSCTRKCHAKDDPDHLDFQCYKPCEKNNKSCKRNHKCPKRCYEDCGECKVEVKVKLNCGHTHQLPCSTDPASVKCNRDCKRTMSCGHKCRLFCFQPCGNCPVKVQKVIPECGHTATVPCCKTPTQNMCKKSCERILPCGHHCTRLCSNPCTSECEELVPSHVRPACGHGVEIPCYWQRKELSPHSADLLLRCEVPCGQTLECDHICRGTCGGCFQGRIHMPCKEKCGRVQICGHSCKTDCAKSCPPCSQKCEYRCIHSRCSNKCGVPCVQCVELCKWRCKHTRCTRLCHQLCNREPCYEACDRKLPCGHDCVGFCGEPCPPLCRVCNKDELTNVFLGYEDEDDARFIYLEDCKHVIESKGLDEWLKRTDNEITLKSCPLCKTHIKRTLRFMNQLKTAYIDIINVKKKVFGNSEAIQERRNELQCRLHDLLLPDILKRNSRHIQGFLLSLRDDLKIEKKGRRNLLSLTDVDSLSVKLEILLNLVKPVKHFGKQLSMLQSSKLAEQFDFLLRFLMKRNMHMSEQEVTDFNLEINRFTRLAQLYHIESSPEFKQYHNVETVFDLHERAFQVINSIQRYTDLQDDKLKNILDRLYKQLKITAAEDIENIKKEVVKIIGLSPGHWFKCPNGHYYVIGECGGAMEVGKCPDCHAQVGGSHHQLLADNRHAGELDGSRAPAYPTLRLF